MKTPLLRRDLDGAKVVEVGAEASAWQRGHHGHERPGHDYLAGGEVVAVGRADVRQPGDGFGRVADDGGARGCADEVVVDVEVHADEAEVDAVWLGPLLREDEATAGCVVGD